MTRYEIKTVEEIVDRTFERFLPEFWSKDSKLTTNYQIITGLTIETSNFTKKVNETFFQLTVNTATGLALDELGRLFKLARKTGESDNSFRQRIRAYYQIFLAGGSNRGIREALALLTDLDVSAITITDDATPLIFSIDIATDNYDLILKLEDIYDIVQLAKAAGTYLKQITFSSLGLVFRVNLSEINGEDLV